MPPSLAQSYRHLLLGVQLRETRNKVKQHLLDVAFFYDNYVQRRYVTRVEEVIILDVTRHEIAREFEELGIFDPLRETLLTTRIVGQRLLHRLDWWGEYCDLRIEMDLTMLRRCASALFDRQFGQGYAAIPHNFIKASLQYM